MSGTTVGLVAIGVLLILLFLDMPIGFTMALVGFSGFAVLGGIDGALANLGILSYRLVANYTFAPIPFFVLMGILSSHGGLARDIYNSAYRWVGGVRGGLAMATVMGCGGFAAISGSSTATAAAIGKIAFPEMQRFKYDPRLAVGSIAAGGTLGILIPPSLGFILYSILTEESIGKLFMAGIFPGILEVVFYMAVIAILCLHNPLMGPAGPKTRLWNKLASLKSVWPMLILFLIVMGSIYMGVCTPSEAGAIGAFGALIIALIMRRLSGKGLIDSLLETGQITAMIMVLFIGAMIFMYFMAITKIPFILADIVAGLPVSKYVTLAAILIMYVLLGCIFDITSMQVLTVPMIFPTILSLGFNPIWFGVLMVRMQEMGMITPPVGMTCFILAGATKTPVSVIFRGVLPFLIADIFHIALLIAIPQISLFLPTIMKGA